MEYFLDCKKEWRPDLCYNMDEPVKTRKVKETGTKGHLLYDPIYRIDGSTEQRMD